MGFLMRMQNNRHYRARQIWRDQAIIGNRLQNLCDDRIFRLVNLRTVKSVQLATSHLSGF